MIDVLRALIGCFTVQHKCSAGTDLDGEWPTACGQWQRGQGTANSSHRDRRSSDLTRRPL